MLAFLQATAATDTVGWTAGTLTVGALFTLAPYALVPALLPVIIGVNLVRHAMGLRQLGAA